MKQPPSPMTRGDISVVHLHVQKINTTLMTAGRLRDCTRAELPIQTQLTATLYCRVIQSINSGTYKFWNFIYYILHVYRRRGSIGVHVYAG